MTIKIPGIDTEKGLDLYDDDEDVYIAVLRSYCSNIPAALDKIRKVSAETLAEYATAVHGIKGTSTTIGAEETRKAALELEMLSKAGDLSGVLQRNGAFIKNTEHLLDNLRDWLTRYDSN